TSLGYISNLTSDAQTQLNNAQSLISGLQTQVNGKVAKTGDIITGTLEVQGGLRTENTGPYLKKKIVEIGDWNMDANPSKDVAHGLGSSYKKIRSISVMVRDDTDTNIYPLERTTQGVSWPG